MVGRGAGPGPLTVSVRFSTVPLGCAGLFMVPLSAFMLYLTVRRDLRWESSQADDHLLRLFVEGSVVYGFSVGAAVVAVAFGYLSFVAWWRIADPVAAVAGPLGIGVHPAILRGRMDWSEIESVSVVAMRSRGWKVGKAIQLRLHNGRGLWRRRKILVQPIDTDDGADERFLDFAARYIPARSINRYLAEA
jgi:hypothetical protein